jgi:FkbM family methyltransferase
MRVRLASWAYRLLSLLRSTGGLTDEVCVIRSGIRWHLELHEGIDFSIYLFGAFEKPAIETYREVLKGIEAPVILDVGANIGAHTLPLAGMAKVSGGRVYSFEPTAWAFGKLRRNLMANPSLSEYVSTYQGYLSDASRRQPPTTVPSSWSLKDRWDTHPVLCSRAMPTEGATSVTLDEFLADEGLERLDLLKLDVDGNELEVLTGAMASIARFMPRNVVEYCPYLDTDGRLEELLGRLAGIGYRFREARPGSPSMDSTDRLKAMIPRQGGMNILLSPVQ